ncbi:MAG: hypothetical protein RLY70_1212, partial [Planctomycetota bacterium]
TNPAYPNPNPPLSAAPMYPREPLATPSAPEYVPPPPAGPATPSYPPAPPAVLAPPPMVNRYPEEVEEDTEEMVEEDMEEEVEEDAEAYEDLPPPGPRYQPPRTNLRTDFYNFCRRACPPGLFFGSQLTMLSPLGETAPVVKLEDLVAERLIISDADGGLGVGTRTWIGFRNQAGSGFRVSYWNLDAQFNTPSPVVPAIAQPTTLDAYYLAAQTADIELMNSFCFGNGFLDISFGARYAKMDRNLTTLGYGEVGPADAKVSLYGVGSIANSVDGLGFTASIGGRNLIWPMDCPPGPGPGCGPLGVSFVWNVRGSILWSETEAFARTEAHAFTKKFGGSTAFNSDSAYACTQDDMVGIGEMQVGFEYHRCLKHFPGFLTVRFAVEGQYWGAGSVSARSDSTAFLIGGPPLFGGAASATAFSEAGDLSLLGASMSASISF